MAETKDQAFRKKVSDFVAESVYGYLDDVREGGSINMNAAAPFIRANFDFDKETARQALAAWMEQF